MTFARRAIQVVQGIAQLRSQPGPALDTEQGGWYVFLLDLAAAFRWSLASPLLDDGRTVLNSSGGWTGAWLRLREDIKGADITGTATIDVGGNRLRYVAVSADAALTLSTTNAAAGDWILFVRTDTTAHTVDIGGLVTMPVSAKSWASVYFNADGAWEAGPSGLML